MGYENSPPGPVYLVVMCLAFVVFNFLWFLHSIAILLKIFYVVILFVIIFGIGISYGFVWGNWDSSHAMKIILYGIGPLLILLPILCDMGKYKESSLALLSVTVPFAFLLFLFLGKRTKKDRDGPSFPPTHFLWNMINNIIWSANLMAGLLVTVEYMYRHSIPTFGFILFVMFLYIFIPSFILISLLNSFLHTKKFSITESFLIISSSMVPFAFLFYIAYMYFWKSRIIRNNMGYDFL